MVDVLAEILVYVRLIEVGNSTSLLTRNKVIFLEPFSIECRKTKTKVITTAN